MLFNDVGVDLLAMLDTVMKLFRCAAELKMGAEIEDWPRQARGRKKRSWRRLMEGELPQKGVVS